jgi:hypothetical protein
VQLEPWHLITFGIALISAFAAVLKILFAQFVKNMDGRFAALHEDAKNWTRLERDFLIFKGDLPLHYVRREDYVRNQAVIEAKLDAVALTLQNIQLKGEANHDHRPR